MFDTKKPPELLKLVDYHHPILRQEMNTVQFPLSDEDKHIINSMIYSIQPEQLKKANAPWDAAVGMAANQWGINKRIFMYCPDGDSVNGLEVIINPSYEPVMEETPDSIQTPKISAEKPAGLPNQDLCWEGCFSVPMASGNIKRYLHIKVKYQNEHGETIVKELQGWPARVWQHENDHLNGILYDDPLARKCIDKRVFKNEEEIDKFYASLRSDRKGA